MDESELRSRLKGANIFSVAAQTGIHEAKLAKFVAGTSDLLSANERDRLRLFFASIDRDAEKRAERDGLT